MSGYHPMADNSIVPATDPPSEDASEPPSFVDFSGSIGDGATGRAAVSGFDGSGMGFGTSDEGGQGPRPSSELTSLIGDETRTYTSEARPFDTGANFGQTENGEIWGTNINLERFQTSFTEFFRKFKESATDEPHYVQLMRQVKFRSSSSDINIDGAHMNAFIPVEFDQLQRFPVDAMVLIETALNSAAHLEHICVENDGVHFIPRPFNLPQNVEVRKLKPAQLETLISITGMVTRTSRIIPEMHEGYFRCVDCGVGIRAKVHRNRILEPPRCERTETGGCGGQLTFQLIHNMSSYLDKQIIKLQEPPECVGEGETPQSITINIHENLIDFVMPGDRVTVTGVYKTSALRLRSTQRTCSAITRPYIEGLHLAKKQKGVVQVNPDDKNDAEFESAFDEAGDLAGDWSPAEVAMYKAIATNPEMPVYELLSRSLAPSIFAKEDVKKGLLCQLVGGVHKSWGFARARGDINVLLCGEPGVAKSQLLQFVGKVVPRGQMTTGKGTSSVGLTASVGRDADTGEPVLESGALVLSDRGICCIDEFDKMTLSAQSILHEVMEQQTISVAKAGIICTLNARCSVLAAANPVGSKWNHSMSTAENLNMPPTILSRFDLVYILKDDIIPAFDVQLATHIVRLFSGEESEDRQKGAILDSANFSKYISYVRAKIKPKISDEALRDLNDAFVKLRMAAATNSQQYVTIRHLESLVRLSEAQAKLRMEHVVERRHVAEALRLFNTARVTNIEAGAPPTHHPATTTA